MNIVLGLGVLSLVMGAVMMNRGIADDYVPAYLIGLVAAIVGFVAVAVSTT